MQRPYFHKLVLSSTIQERRLRIPENFLKKFGHELTAFARLIVPDGRIWQVGLRKIDNKVWFHDGWQEFMNCFSIQIGYFLAFRYEGNSTFKIYIFNLPSSEISYQTGNLSSSGKLNGKLCNIFEEMEDDESDEFLGMSPSSAAMKSKVFTESADKLGLGKNYNPPALQNLFNGSNFPNCISRETGHGTNTPAQATKDTGAVVTASEIKGSPEQMKMLASGNEVGSLTKPKRKRQSSSANKQGTSTPRDEEAEARYRFYESASARKRTVTAEERERALNAAKVFEPANPFCRVVLRPSYLYRGCIMYLPSCFAEKNLNGVSGFIKLQLPNGKQWPVRCLYKGGRAKLSQGWYDFCLENNLEEGDVCIFELLRAKEVILQITVFRVLENHGPLNQPLQQNVYQTKVIKK